MNIHTDVCANVPLNIKKTAVCAHIEYFSGNKDILYLSGQIYQDMHINEKFSKNNVQRLKAQHFKFNLFKAMSSTESSCKNLKYLKPGLWVSKST